MATQGQFLYFFATVFFGFLGGFIWQAISLIRLPFCAKKAEKFVKIGADILFFMVFGGICCLLAAQFCFPDHRLYMYVGYALGLLIYSKTLKNLLDFLKKVCYNTINTLSKRICKARKKGKEKL